MKTLVIGYGRSGRAAEAWLRSQGSQVCVLADDSRDAVDGLFDFAVVSPGVPLSHPWVVDARLRGIPLVSELQLGCEALRRLGWKLLAVTGSKGKSSVVKIVTEALVGSGRQAVACGNYGVPVCEVACADLGARGRERREQWAVVEVSSFMLETTELSADSFVAAAVLNLQEDHLDRHGSVAAYHGLKRKLLGMTRRPIEPQTPPFREAAIWENSYFDNEILSGNAAAAVALMRAAGAGAAEMRQAFASFSPLPHRMNIVATHGGVRYIDDSKATSLAALAAGVRMASLGGRDVRLIAGGLPKGDDPKNVGCVLTERVKKVYLIGHCAEQFHTAWKGVADCEICGTLEVAVERARREAVRGETVLLSPGAASFDQFHSFGERGDVFARLVKKEEKEK